MFRNKWFLMDATDDPVPAGGGGETAPSSPAPASAGSDVDWAGESVPDHEIEGLTVTPAKPVEKPAAPSAATPPTPPATPPSTPPQAPAPATPPAQPAAATPLATPPATPPVAQEPQEPVAPPAPAAPPVDQAALRTKYVQDLTAKYALSEDQARGFLVEPEKHLPELMAKLHVDVADAVIGTIMQQLPMVVTNLTSQSSAAQEAQREFYGTWPMLQKPEYEPTVTNAIKAYRQVNPKASRQEVIRAAGLTALISLRLPLPQELLNAPAPQPPAPPPGFTHAAPGAGGMPPPAQPQQNPFQLLNEELDREERGT